MATEKVDIEFEITGIQPAVSSVGQLEDALKDVDKVAKKTEKQLEETADAAKDVGKAGKEAGDVGGAGLKVIDEATGGLGTRLVETGRATKVLGKSFITSFKAGVMGASAMGKALIATGIGAIIVGVGLLVAYWDDIVGAVSGVSAESAKQLQNVQDTVAAQQDALKAISAQENSLKLQGKSEAEIRDLKIQQTNEVINAMEAQLMLQKEQAEAAEKASQRNKDIAQGVIAFLTLPITMLLGTVDALTKALSYIPGIDIATNLADDFTGGIAGMIFDPEEVKAEGDATIKETENQLAALKNTRDGYIIQGKESDAKNREEKLAADKAAEDEAIEYAKTKAQELADLKTAIRTAEANTEAEMRTNALEDLDLYYEQLIQKATDQDLATTELEDSRLQAVNALKKKYADEDEKRIADAKKASDEKAKFDKQLAQDVASATLGVAASAFDAVGQMAGEGSALAKASGVASATISTYESATAAYKSVVGIPVVGPTLAPIAAGVAVAGGLMTVKKILATKIPGNKSGGGGGSLPSLPAAPVFNPTAALESSSEGQDQNNQVTLGEQSGSSGPQVIKAYVVSSDMSTQQERDAKITDLARL